MASTETPDLKFTTVGSKREVFLRNLPKTSLVLMVAQETGGETEPVLAAVREVYPDAEAMPVLNVVDLKKIPRLVRKVAEGMLKGRYEERAQAVPPGTDPAERVFILPDWEGKLAPALGLGDVSKRMAMAVIGPDGKLYGTYQGDDAAKAALDLLRAALD